MAERQLIPDMKTALADLKKYEEDYEIAREKYEKMETEMCRIRLKTDELKYKTKNTIKERVSYDNKYKQNDKEICNLHIEEANLHLKMKAFEVQCNLPAATTSPPIIPFVKQETHVEEQLEAAKLQLKALHEQVTNNDIAYEKLMDILKSPSDDVQAHIS